VTSPFCVNTMQRQEWGDLDDVDELRQRVAVIERHLGIKRHLPPAYSAH
jgi:hypothetical protein